MEPLIRDYSKINDLGFGLVAINPNIHPDYPKDSFENMIKLSEELNLPFEYLLDETQTQQKVIVQYVLDIFIIDNDYKLHTEVPMMTIGKTKNLLKSLFIKLFNKLFKRQKTIPNNKRSIGCSIKWQNEN